MTSPILRDRYGVGGQRSGEGQGSKVRGRPQPWAAPGPPAALPQGRAMLRAPCPLGPPHGRLLLPDAAAAALRLLPPLPGVSRHGGRGRGGGSGRELGVKGTGGRYGGREGSRGAPRRCYGDGERPAGAARARGVAVGRGGRSALWGYGRDGPLHRAGLRGCRTPPINTTIP